MGKSGFIGRLVSAYYPARWQAAAWTVNLFGVRGLCFAPGVAFVPGVWARVFGL